MAVSAGCGDPDLLAVNDYQCHAMGLCVRWICLVGPISREEPVSGAQPSGRTN